VGNKETRLHRIHERRFTVTKDTEKLFRAFEIALGNAWLRDQNEFASDRSLREAWEKSNVARKALVTRIEELEQVVAHDSAP
jgi:hypothetical protein